MKTRMIAGALGLLLFCCCFVVPPAQAHETCSLKTLDGSYGFLAQATVVTQLPGYPPPPVLIVTSGIITYDGEGNLSGESTNNLNGLVTFSGTLTGTYTVNPDCTFSGQHTDSTGETLHFVGTITGSGMLQEIRFVLTDPGVVAYGADRKIPPGGCSLGTLKGSYGLYGAGTVTANNPPALIAHVGTVYYDGAGNFAGHDTVELNGATVPDSFTGTYTVSADCTVSLEIHSTAFGVLHEIGRITGEEKAQEVHFIYTDPGLLATDAIRKQ